MAEKLTLKAEKRQILGKKVKKLRREGFLPGNIYGKGVKSLSVKLGEVDFEKVFKKAGETQIVEIEIGKEKRPVLVSNVQFDPRTDKPLHVDLLQVDLKKKVTAEIPIELVGESPAEKEGKGTVVQQLSELRVEALPTELPEKIEVSIEPLVDVDQLISVSDLKIDAKLTVLDDKELVVVKVEALREEEPEPVPVTPQGEEGEEAKGEGEEGEEAKGAEEETKGEEEKKEEES